MGREESILCFVLTVVMLSSCSLEATISPQAEKYKTSVAVTFSSEEDGVKTPGSESGEHNDISLLVFDSFGKAEANIRLNGLQHSLELVSGETYSFYACAGFDQDIFADDICEMDELTYSFTGFLMEESGRKPKCAYLKDVTITDSTEIHLELKNMLVKVSLSFDRRRLNEDVTMNVTGLKICNCPIYTYVFRPWDGSQIAERRNLKWESADMEDMNNTTEENADMEIYMPEEFTSDELNSEDIGLQDCRYLEIELDYLSDTRFTAEEPLIYRLHIGDSLRCSDLMRNTHHKISICPIGDGLSSEGWRIDKTNLKEFGPSRFASFPESYIQGDIGDTLHLRCEFYPPHAPFDVGLEELEYDKAEGIYDYIIDEDGHGVRLILTGPGTGIVYMEAGSPVNEAAMWVIEVNLPSGPETVTDTSPYKSPCRTSTVQEFQQRQDVLLRHRPQARGLSPSPPHG